MGNKSLLEKFTNALLDKDEESAEDIDRDVTSAVRSIEQNRGETLNGTAVLLDHWGRRGDLVYIMDLIPFYAAIGGRDSMMAARLPEACENVYAHHIAEGGGHGHVEGDFFFMRFIDASDKVGFRKAVEIINDIGSLMMGERFLKIELPALVVVSDAGDITDENGHIVLSKARSAVKSGGIRFSMDEPGPDDPEWLKHVWKNRKAAPKPVDTDWHTMHHRKPTDPDWVKRGGDRRTMVVMDPSRPEHRSGQPRRATDHVTEKDW